MSADAPTVIVSGGTYGIGRAITLELAQRGWRVVAFGLEEAQPGSAAVRGIEGTRKALASAGLEAELLEADVADPAQLAALVRHTREHYGRVDGLVNNAAIRPTGTILETDEATFDRVIAVNLKGVYCLCREVIPIMREANGGSIVNIGSGAGRGKPGLLAYATSKGGVFALSAALAHDHERDAIRVNVVVPEPRTPSGMVEAMNSEGAPARTTATDVARAVAFLLSEESSGVSGAVVNVGEFAETGS